MSKPIKSLAEIFNEEHAATGGDTKTFSSGLKTFRVSNGALKADKLPTRLKIFSWGANNSTDGVFSAGNKTASQMPDNQKKFGFERVAIDFDHCSVPGTAAHKELIQAGQPPLIFGYGTVNAVPGDGIFLDDIVWTPLGQQHARNFEDISPALKDDQGEVTMIHSVALTPNGKITGLQFFSADRAAKNWLDPKNAIDLAAIFDAEAEEANDPTIARIFSARTSLKTVKRPIKDDKGRIDLAALFDAENEKRGMR